MMGTWSTKRKIIFALSGLGILGMVLVFLPGVRTFIIGFMENFVLQRPLEDHGKWHSVMLIGSILGIALFAIICCCTTMFWEQTKQRVKHITNFGSNWSRERKIVFALCGFGILVLIPIQLPYVRILIISFMENFILQRPLEDPNKWHNLMSIWSICGIVFFGLISFCTVRRPFHTLWGQRKCLRYFEHFEENNYFLKWYGAQPIAAKVGFYGAAVIALLTHLVMYSNLILEQHLAGFRRSALMTAHGRWFHNWANSLTFYYMNWVTGLLQVLFLALTVFFVIKAFAIQNKLNALLIAGIMVTFPAIAESNLFFHDAAPYFFAAFLSIAAFYVTKIYRFGWFLGVVFITLSLAIYQSKISLAMMASLIHLIVYVLKEKQKLAGLIKYATRYLLLVLGGLSVYLISMPVASRIHGIRLTGYRGIGDSPNLAGLHNDILRAYREVPYYFFSGSFRIDSHYLTLAYGFIAIMGLLLLVLVIIKYSNKNILNKVIVTILVFLLPLSANFSRVFDAGGVGVLTMTSYAFTFFLLLPLILFENFNINTYGFKKLLTLALVFIIGYYISFSNFIYLRGQVYAAHAVQLANRISARVEPLLPYTSNNQLFVTGNLVGNPIYPNMNIFWEYHPRAATIGAAGQLFGGNNDFTGWPQGFFVNVIRYRVGLNVNHAGNIVRRQYLQDRAISYGMPVYPQEGSVAIIDGVVVAMLNFFARLDVEEVSPNAFVATANHTGRSSSLDFEYIWYIYRDGQRKNRIDTDYYSEHQVFFSIVEPGSYQFRVFIRLADGRNIINSLSPNFEVSHNKE